MKVIQRHMQSLTLLAIAGILLVIAFYISQQTRSGSRPSRLSAPANADVNSLQDMPECADLTATEPRLVCYADAAQVSEALVLSKVDEISQLETNSSRQVELIESQIAWEDARNAECAFFGGAGDDDIADLEEYICLTNQNLARLSRLEQYRVDWLCAQDCEDEIAAGE